MTDLPTISGSIEQDSWEEDVKILTQKVKPTWKAVDLKVSILNGGYINGIYRCQNLKSDENSLLFRVFNVKLNLDEMKQDWDGSKFTEEERKAYEERAKQMMSHENEITVMRDMGELGLAAKFHAKFDNGICYDFVEGEVLTSSIIKENPEIVDQLAKMVGRLHSYQPPKNLADKKAENQTTAGSFQSVLANWLKQTMGAVKAASEIRKDGRFKEFIELIGDLDQEIEDTCIESDTDLVWCHEDLNLANIIYNAKTGELKFIDWEMTNYNNPERDIGYLFSNFAEHIDKGYDLSYYPTEETQKRFLRLYLQTYYSQLNKKPKVSIEDTLEKLYRLSNRAALHAHLAIGMISASLAAREDKESAKDKNDLLSYSIARIKAYRTQKNTFLAI